MKTLTYFANNIESMNFFYQYNSIRLEGEIVILVYE